MPDDMLERFVLIEEGQRVYDMEQVTRVLNLAEFKQSYAASYTMIQDSHGKPKRVNHTTLWQDSEDRRVANTLTFHPGHSIYTHDPSGRSAVNTWRPTPLVEVNGWQQKVEPFLDHVAWLWKTDDAEWFIDWLAHIVQRPGEVLHHHWCHVAPQQGLGRNWVSSVLARVFAGMTASNFNLQQTLKDGFNGSLSRKLLVVVDEINIGADMRAKHQVENELKKLVNAETIEINNKFGRKVQEYARLRWLVFSNSITAMPINADERRWNIVYDDSKPKSEAYYLGLYRALQDPAFIQAVHYYLGTRNIDDATSSPVAKVIQTLVDLWPSDLITSGDLMEIVCNEVNARSINSLSNSERLNLTKQIAFAANDLGVFKHVQEKKGQTIETQIRLSTNNKHRVYVLRNPDLYVEMRNFKIKDHIFEWITKGEQEMGAIKLFDKILTDESEESSGTN
jgi:hypothetical protein